MRPTCQHISTFADRRFIRDAFAVHLTLQRLGDQRVDPCFHWPFCIDMSPSETPGCSSTACTQFFVDDAGLRLLGIVSALPTPFTLRFP